MEQEPFFLVNEFLEKEKQEIENILRVIEVKNLKRSEKAVFLRNFSNELFKAYRKNKKSNVKEIKNEFVDHKKNERDLLLKKKEELITKLNSLQPVNVNIEKNEVILSKETGKSLVTTEFNGTKYTVKEPEISSNDINLINELESRSINLDNKNNLIKEMKNLALKYNINYSEDYYDSIRYYLVRDLKKYGKVSPLIEDKNVKEIICNGVSKPLIITYQDKNDIETNVIFDSEKELNDFVLNIGKRLNTKVSEDNPFINSVLDNFNIQATFGSEFIKGKFLISKN